VLKHLTTAQRQRAELLEHDMKDAVGLAGREKRVRKADDDEAPWRA